MSCPIGPALEKEPKSLIRASFRILPRNLGHNLRNFQWLETISRRNLRLMIQKLLHVLDSLSALLLMLERRLFSSTLGLQQRALQKPVSRVHEMVLR